MLSGAGVRSVRAASSSYVPPERSGSTGFLSWSSLGTDLSAALGLELGLRLVRSLRTELARLRETFRRAPGCLTAAGTGGRQFAQGPYFAAASARCISILLLRRELHESRMVF